MKLKMTMSSSLVFFLLILSTESVLPGDWPQWRGPSRNGISEETDILKKWPASGPRIMWRIPIGAGYSGISVSGNAAYTMWDADGEQLLLRLDILTGKEIWRQKISQTFDSSWGNGPRSSPAVSDGLVYAISADGKMVAVSVQSGQLRWKHDLIMEFGGRIPSYGYASSPLVEKDKIFVEVGAEDSAFMAFDKKNGAVIWNSQTDQPAYSSPIAISLNGQRQILFWSASGFHAVNPENGTLLWQHPWQTSCPSTGIPVNSMTPIFIGPDKIFISNGYGTWVGSAVFQIQHAENTFLPKTLWQTKKMKNLINSSVFYKGHIYGFDKGIFKCIETKAGEVKWQARGFQRGSLILVAGHLIVLGERGKLALVEANPDRYVEKASVQIMDGRCWTAPSLADGRLYLRNSEEMLCLDFTMEQ